MIIWMMFVAISAAALVHFNDKIDTKDVTTSDAVQDIVMELQNLLNGVEDDVSKLEDLSSAIVDNLQLPLEEGLNRIDVFRLIIANAKIEIWKSCDFRKHKKKGFPSKAVLKKKRFRNIVALLEKVPEFFGEGAFRLNEDTKVAINKACDKPKGLKALTQKKYMEVEDLEKLRTALCKVRNDFLRLNRTVKAFGQFVSIFHECDDASKAVEEFESVCRDVYMSFRGTDLENETLVMFEETQRLTEAVKHHIENGEEMMEEIKRLQASTEKNEEVVNAFDEKLYNAFVNARYEMSFKKEEFLHLKPPLLCFIANMELGKLWIRNERLRIFISTRNG